jgi:hypothetical protein
MKTKILLSFALLFFAIINTNAQITKGRYLLGGSASYYNSSTDNNNSGYLNLQFGKVVKLNTVVGITGSLSASKNHYGNNGYKLYQYNAGIFYRKYKPLVEKLNFFAEMDAVLQHGSNYGTYFFNVGQNLYTNLNGIQLSFMPGLSYAVTKNLQLELTMPNLATISYASIKTVDSKLPAGVSPQKGNNFSANVNLNANLINNFGIGFKFLLGK